MASISFDATLDTSKLEASIKSSNQTIKSWADGVEKAGGQADAGLNKMTKSFKDAIKDQKALIKSIEQDVKSLQKAYDDATAGKAKQAAGGDLRSAKRALAEEQGTLLGLQKQQITANEEESSGIGRLVGGLGKWVMGLASVGAALKIAKGIIASTEGTATSFEIIVAQATSGIGYFFKSIASGDWSNFTENLSKAIKGAKEFVDQMEVINNQRNETNIKTAELDIKIGEQRERSYSTDVAVQKDALTKIIALQKEKFDMIAKLSKEEYQLNLEKAATDSGMAKDRIENFITEYSSLEKMLKVGKEYNEYSKLAGMGAMDKSHFKNLFSDSGEMAKGAEEAGKYVEQISKVTEEARKKLSDFRATELKDEAAFNLNNRRDKQRLIGIEKQELDDKKKADEDAKKQAIEDAKLKNQIAKQTDLLYKAVEDGNTAEIKSIADKIKALQDELNIRTKIANVALLTAYGGAVKPISTSNIKPSISGAGQIPILPGIQQASTEAQKGADLGKAKQWNVDEEDSLKRQAKLRQEIANGVADLVSQIGQQIGLDDKSMALLNAGLDAFTALATGDIVGAAISLLSGIIAQIPSAASRFEAQIGHINQLLEEQKRLIDQSTQKGGQEAARKDEIADLEKKAALQKAEAWRLQQSANMHLDLLGWRQKKADEANAAWQETTNLIEDSNQALTEFFSNTTASTIADSISQGFQDGDTSAADFADRFNGFMTDAINSALKEMSKPEIAAWYKQFAIDLESGGGLSKEEIAALKIDWDKIIAEGKANRDAVSSVTGIDLNANTAANTGLTGIVRNMSEDTGNELTGLFRRFADEQRVVKDYSILGVAHLVGIEANTMNTVLELQKANIKLDTVISNTNINYGANPGLG